MTLDYDNPKDAEPKMSGWRVVLLCCAGALILFVVGFLLFIPTLGRASETANRIKCGNCLRQIGLAAEIYARNHGGALPPDLIALYRHHDGDITPEVFTCPSSEVFEAQGANQDEIVAEMLSGDHLSYTWTGTGLTTAAPADVIVAFDIEMHGPKDNATTTGMNVLFADGNVSFVIEADAKAIRAQFHAGVRPIRLATTAPASR